MPFDGLQELKQSALFRKSEALQSLSERRLERFLRAFEAVFARVLRNGGDEKGAERLALSLGLMVARNASFNVAPVESIKHFFSPMVPQMSGRDPKTGKVEATELSFDVITQDRAVANALLVGNSFNLDHDRGEPVGVIHGLMAVEDAPPEVQAATDPDVPFLVVASYLKDTPDDIRQIDTLSPEWIAIRRPDGLHEALPHAFALSRSPMNGKELGVRRISSAVVDPPEVSDDDIKQAVREALGK